ncbi:MAG: ABC transporter ATP-binding protein [Elusimicrobiota bacterium]
MNSPGNAIEIRGLTVSFGSFIAVDDISFTVSKGEIFGFLGANGAGKTTTMRVLCGLLVPDSGEVKVAGISLEGNTGQIKEKVGYMSQRFTLYDDLTVRENLDFKAALRKMDTFAARKKSRELLDFIGFKGSPDMLVKNLPAGLKQQVSLAASIIHDPEVIFLDEPTSGVSPAVRARFWELIRTLAGQGKTIIVTTHYMDEAEECGRIALMQKGRVISLACPEEMKEDAYPEPLVELTAGKDRLRAETEKILGNTGGIIRYWPYGMKYHALLKDEASYEKFIGGLSENIFFKRIKPSLEDVFIRLASGEKW